MQRSTLGMSAFSVAMAQVYKGSPLSVKFISTWPTTSIATQTTTCLQLSHEILPAQQCVGANAATTTVTPLHTSGVTLYQKRLFVPKTRLRPT